MARQKPWKAILARRSGTIECEDGTILKSYETENEYLWQFQKAFWTMEEACAYANSCDTTELADHSEILDPRSFRNRGRKKAKWACKKIHSNFPRWGCSATRDCQSELSRSCPPTASCGCHISEIWLVRLQILHLNKPCQRRKIWFGDVFNLWDHITFLKLNSINFVCVLFKMANQCVGF